MVEVKKFYDNCVSVYPLIDVFLKPQKKDLVNYVNSLPHGKLLEVGIGTGSHIPMYNKHDITGIDISQKSIDVAHKRPCSTRLTLKAMNGEEMEFEDSFFDYVVISHVIAVTENPDKMIRECFRVMKENGLLIILNHETPENGIRHVDRFFNKFSRQLKLTPYFKIRSISSLQSFAVVEERCMGFFNYFKLMILKKARENPVNNAGASELTSGKGAKDHCSQIQTGETL